MSEKNFVLSGELFCHHVDYPERMIIIKEKLFQYNYSEKRRLIQAVNVYQKNIKYDDWIAGETERQIDRGLELFAHIASRKSAIKFVRDCNPELKITVEKTIEKRGAKYHVLICE